MSLGWLRSVMVMGVLLGARRACTAHWADSAGHAANAGIRALEQRAARQRVEVPETAPFAPTIVEKDAGSAGCFR